MFDAAVVVDEISVGLLDQRFELRDLMRAATDVEDCRAGQSQAVGLIAGAIRQQAFNLPIDKVELGFKGVAFLLGAAEGAPCSRLQRRFDAAPAVRDERFRAPGIC